MTIWVVIPECRLYLISKCWIIVWTTLQHTAHLSQSVNITNITSSSPGWRIFQS